MKAKFKVLITTVLTMVTSLIMSVKVFADDPPPPTLANFDVVGPITQGMNQLLTQVLAVISAVAPGAITIVGSVLAITVGIRVFRSLVGR